MSGQRALACAGGVLGAPGGNVQECSERCGATESQVCGARVAHAQPPRARGKIWVPSSCAGPPLHASSAAGARAAKLARDGRAGAVWGRYGAAALLAEQTMSVHGDPRCVVDSRLPGTCALTAKAQHCLLALRLM